MMSTAWTHGSTRQWRRLRATILARDNWQCRAHTDGWCHHNPAPHTCTHHATQVHHTHGRHTTGDDPDHLIASCRTCNLHIGDPTRWTDPPARPWSEW